MLLILNINKNDYVAIVTRGHSCDGDCLYYILTHELPGYLGMIGSKKRVSAQFKMFREMGVPEEKIAQVHNLIGLPINGVTPPEIARTYFRKENEKNRWNGADRA